MINSNSFYICDTTEYGKYVRNGTAKNLKIPVVLEYKGLKDSGLAQLEQNL